jgi:hypothetical protein
MICSHEEFCLLLNKWDRDSNELFVITVIEESKEGPARSLSVVLGTLVELNEERFAIKDENGNVAMVRYAECNFAYESEYPSWGATYLTGRKFEDVVVLATPAGISIAVGSTSKPTSSG